MTNSGRSLQDRPFYLRGGLMGTKSSPHAGLTAIPGYPTYYADEDGDIWCDTVKWSRAKSRGVPWMLSAHLDAKGYLKVNVKLPCGTNRVVSVHSLVCRAFYGLRTARCEVLHLDENSLNNRPSNLTWVTRSESQSGRNKCRKPIRGENHWASTVTECDVANICKSLADGMSFEDTASAHSTEVHVVRHINYGKNWRWLVDRLGYAIPIKGRIANGASCPTG